MKSLYPSRSGRVGVRTRLPFEAPVAAYVDAGADDAGVFLVIGG
jgi:hypothetical protein